METATMEQQPIFRVQNSKQIDLHRKDPSSDREWTVACNLNAWDAELFVRCVNSYEELVDALVMSRNILVGLNLSDSPKYDAVFGIIDEALTKAQG